MPYSEPIVSLPHFLLEDEDKKQPVRIEKRSYSKLNLGRKAYQISKTLPNKKRQKLNSPLKQSMYVCANDADPCIH